MTDINESNFSASEEPASEEEKPKEEEEQNRVKVRFCVFF